ncbi:DUF2569 family protein [Billgrantia sp. C5P2]|uniref:DUF2569 family protein n=1 Tax=Billgrantia sp. C5P2 TaxID=3436239 RepID=UPI003DA2546E
MPHQVGQPGADSEPADRTRICSELKPSGIGGWLLVLIGVLMVVVPLIGVASLLSHFAVLKYLHPSLVGEPGWREYRLWMWLAVAATSLLSIYGSIRLLCGRSAKDVEAVSTIIWVIGPISAVVVHALIPYWLHSAEKLMYDYIGPTGTPLVGAIIGGALFSLIWVSYLNRSTRVCNTYGRPKMNPRRPVET